jgi:hypothetical protein
MGGAPPFEDGACSLTTRSDGDPHSELLDRVSGLLNGPRRLVARTATKKRTLRISGMDPRRLGSARNRPCQRHCAPC